jgi:uncharacterized protein (UPF0212 family)
MHNNPSLAWSIIILAAVFLVIELNYRIQERKRRKHAAMMAKKPIGSSEKSVIDRRV